MDFEEFHNIFAANFRQLPEKGLNEWRAFVETVTSPALMRKVIEELAATRAAQRANGAAVTVAPGLAEMKTAFFTECRIAAKNKERREFGSTGACWKCGGRHWVKVIPVDAPEFRDKWRPVLPEEITFQQFRPFEMAPCPQCCGAKYGDPRLRDEVSRCALPDNASLASIGGRFANDER